MKVINLYGGPGSGKSTVAAGLFYRMKMLHLNVELVTEYAKDLVYGNMLDMLLDQQEYIFAEQNYRLHRLRKHVDFAITDSPLMLSTIYTSDDYPCIDHFHDLVEATYATYDNINIFLERPETFSEVGRAHNLEQSKSLDSNIEAMLGHYRLPYKVYQSDQDTVEKILYTEIVDPIDMVPYK